MPHSQICNYLHINVHSHAYTTNKCPKIRTIWLWLTSIDSQWHSAALSLLQIWVGVRSKARYQPGYHSNSNGFYKGICSKGEGSQTLWPCWAGSNICKRVNIHFIEFHRVSASYPRAWGLGPFRCLCSEWRRSMDGALLRSEGRRSKMERDRGTLGRRCMGALYSMAGHAVGTSKAKLMQKGTTHSKTIYMTTYNPLISGLCLGFMVPKHTLL